MTFPTALIEALEIQAEVAGTIRPPQLRQPSACPGWSVRDVLNHSLGVTRKFTAFAAGETERPTAPPGDLLGADHPLTLRQATGAAGRAWLSADLTRSCHLPFGTFPADLAAGINLFDALAHTWDVATPLGLPWDAPDPLWELALEAAVAVIGPERDATHYGEALRCRPTAPPREQFLAFVGRDDRGATVR